MYTVRLKGMARYSNSQTSAGEEWFVHIHFFFHQRGDGYKRSRDFFA